MKKRWDLLPPSPLSLPSSNTLSTAFPKYLPGHTTDRPERTPQCATESRASPSQQPQLSAGLWQSQEPFSDGKLILFVSSNQAQWLVSAGKFDLLHFLWPYISSWSLSLRHQGKAGVISIAQDPELDSKLPAPAVCCNPEYPLEHQNTDFLHWNLPLKLKSDPELIEWGSVSSVFEIRGGESTSIWTHMTNALQSMDISIAIELNALKTPKIFQIEFQTKFLYED